MTAVGQRDRRTRLRPLRRRELLHRSLYTSEHPGPDGRTATWTVEIDASRDWHARLYCDGRRERGAQMPAVLPVPGGRIEVDAWLNTTLLLAGAVAAVERALTLRRNRVLDAETLWTNF